MTEEAMKLGKQAVVVYCQRDGMAYSLLSKREYFAGLAMQGILANGTILNNQGVAKRATTYTDALLEELVTNKTETE